VPSPLNVTSIPAPRTPLTDPATGLLSREWYRFFLNLFNLTGGGSNPTSLEDLQIGPPFATVDEITNSTDIKIQGFATSPSQDALLAQIAELQKQVQAAELSTEGLINVLLAQITELQKQLDGLKMQVQPQLGTMAPLQQDNLPWVRFDTTPQSVPDTITGTLYWDDADRSKTLAIVMEDTGQIIQDIGEETFYRIKATATITKGQVVMFTGSVGASGGLKGAPATGLTPTQSEYILGIATQNIANNGWGYVTWFGEIKGVNTTGGAEAWVDGQILYYNPAVTGGLTKNIPTAPNPKVIVAAVVHAASNGILFVRPTFGSALGATDSNVEITGLAGGDLLQYDSGQSRWENVPASTVIAGTSGAPVTKTADFTVAANETWLINNKSGSTCTVTLPTASSYTGRILTFQNYQAQFLVSASSNVVPLAGGAAGTAILEDVAGNWATLVSDGTNWVMMQEAPNNVMLI
jgi:hypothetical protein